MANEYAVNHDDLKAVAKAIRDKGKTTEVLTFPVGFISAVEAISGGGLNFEVVGGTEQPANPNVNMIWVNTSAEIVNWAITQEEPTSPDEGLLWIKAMDSSGGTELVVGEDNKIILYLGHAKLYTSSGWEQVEAALFADGQWNYFSSVGYFLFAQGEGALINFYNNSQANASVTIGTDSIVVTSTMGSSSRASLVSSSSFDFSTLEYNTLVFELKCTGIGSSMSLRVGVFTQNGVEDPEKVSVATAVPNVSDEVQKINIDISNINGKYYVGFMGIGRMECYNIYMV